MKKGCLVGLAAIGGLAILLMGLSVLVHLANEKPSIDVSSNDIPVVIRTNGGLLEVATVKQRRNFDLTEPLDILGYELPFCEEAAAFRATTFTTYRVKLAKRWGADLENGRLLVTAPALEPSLPVAFDTEGLEATLDKCWAMPNRGTDRKLMKSLSRQMAATAEGKAMKAFARDHGARDTVREFVQKWLVAQKGYDIPANTPIDVEFADE